MRSTFHIGQLVRLSERASGREDGRVYCVVNILTSRDEGTPTYLIKSMAGAERLVKPQDIKEASGNAVP